MSLISSRVGRAFGDPFGDSGPRKHRAINCNLINGTVESPGNIRRRTNQKRRVVIGFISVGHDHIDHFDPIDIKAHVAIDSAGIAGHQVLPLTCFDGASGGVGGCNIIGGGLVADPQLPLVGVLIDQIPSASRGETHRTNRTQQRRGGRVWFDPQFNGKRVNPGVRRIEGRVVGDADRADVTCCI